MVVSGVRVNFKQEHNIHLDRHCCGHNSGLTVVVNELFIYNLSFGDCINHAHVICANTTDLQCEKE